MPRTPASLPSGARISDYVTLGVLATTVTGELVDAVLAATGRESQRQRQLPARFVVYYVMALALYAQASYGEVLRCLLEGIRWLRLGGADLALATKSSITKARRRLGPAPLAELYRRVARPLAEPGLPGCFFRGRRLVSGTTIDLPDAPDLVTRFGRPAASRGESAFPQLRLMALAEPTRCSPPPSTTSTSARRRSRAACSTTCGPACCAWPTAPSSASRCGPRRRPPVPTCCGACASTKSCPAPRSCPMARP